MIYLAYSLIYKTVLIPQLSKSICSTHTSGQYFVI